jgi:hypothetical protein
MDIWNWIENFTDSLYEAGQGASAHILLGLTQHVGDLEIERADAMLPEARALAKSLENPWLEVYVGHWEMRNRLGNRLEGETALADAVALFERAHRPDTIDCPQSVCVTQDLVDCYDNIDGLGFANERRAAIEETLARIDPSWNCFVCLSAQYADTLNSEERHEEALAWLDTQETRMREAKVENDQLYLSRAFSLIGLERFAEALEILEADTQDEEDLMEDERQERQTTLALILARLGRDEEAWKTLPPWARTAPSNQPVWIKAAANLLERDPARNTWQLGSDFHAALEQFSRFGSHRLVVDLAPIVARLALARHARWNAQRLLALARRHQPSLKIDGGAAANLDALELNIAAAAVSPLPVPAAELIDWLNEREARNPEHEIDWLLAACRQRPDDSPLAALAASAMRACGAGEDAEKLLWAHLAAHPTAPADDVAAQLLDASLQRGERERIDALAHHFDTIEPAFACWCRARFAAREKDWERVVTLTEGALAVAPEHAGLLRLLAEGLQGQKRFADAAAAWLRLAGSREDRNVLWDHMTCATAIGDWEAVRASAAKLDLQFDSDNGPIDEDWGWTIIRYIEDGEPCDYYARRTGPVSARILENARPRQPQHVLDEVVFDAAYLEQPPQDEEERKKFIYTYAHVHTVRAANHSPSWPVEGVHPGEERMEALFAALERQGHHVWVHSSHYEIEDSQNKETLRGLYFTVASPPRLGARALHKLLCEQSRDLPHGLCWLRLAEQCGADTAPHRALIARYGL